MARETKRGFGENRGMPLLPELEAYQTRLEDRAAAWDETGDEVLIADLARCDEQVRLLERSLTQLSGTLEAMPAEAREDRQRGERRQRVLTQTRDLTAAYAHVLRGHMARRGQA